MIAGYDRKHSQPDVKLSDVAKSGFFLCGIGIGVLVWLVDPFIDAVFLHEGTIYQQLTGPSTSEIYMRAVISSIIIIFSFFGSLLLIRSNRIEKGLRENQQALRQYYHIQDIVSKILHYSLEPVTLKEILEYTLDVILAEPIFSFQKEGSIFLADEGNEMLNLEVHHNLHASLQKACARLPYGRCLCGRAASSREVIFASDVDEQHETTYADMSPHGHYCVPILSGQRLLGVINAYVNAGHTRTSEEEKFLTMIADTLSGIIERKQTEEALQESEERYRELYDENPSMFFTVDTLGKVLSVNQYGADQLGYTIDELTGTSVTDIFCEEDKKAVLPQLEQCIENPDFIHNWELRKVKKDGAVISVRETAHVITDVDGFSKILIVCEDITERKQAKKAMQEGNRLNQVLLDSFPCVALLLRPDCEIVASNRAGRDAGAVPGEKCFASWGQRDNRCPWCLAPKVLKTGEAQHLEVDAIQIIWDAHWIPIEKDLYLHYAFDITEKRKMEKQLQQNQKMESIGTLAGGIAHDINNSLAAIMGFTELAYSDLHENNKAKTYLKKSLNSSQRVKDLVNRILTFSRKTELKLEPMYLSSIVNEVLNMLKATLPATIEISQEVKKDFGMIEADSVQIHQVLMNLCTNAAQAMDNDKGDILDVSLNEIDIEAADKHLDLHPGKYLRLTISDTGSGIDPETMERIFEPYFTTKDKGLGTGLGLAIAHGIVKDHGGIITVDSKPGKGTTFNIYFPKIEIEATRETVADEPLTGGIERILFVDDEPDLVDIGKQMLENLGYEVITRTDSVEALELFRTQPDQFDLVITDMTMPHMAGDKLTKEIMAIRSDTPIILSTGYSERISEVTARGIGIKAYIMKPWTSTYLANTVRKVLDENIIGSNIS